MDEFKKLAMVFFAGVLLAALMFPGTGSSTSSLIDVDDRTLATVFVDRITKWDPKSEYGIALRRAIKDSAGPFQDISEDIRIYLTDEPIGYEAKACANSFLFKSRENVFFRIKDIAGLPDTVAEVDTERLMFFSVQSEQLACKDSVATYEIWVSRSAFDVVTGLDLTDLDFIEAKANFSIKGKVQ